MDLDLTPVSNLIDSLGTIALLLVWIRAERDEKLWYRDRLYRRINKQPDDDDDDDDDA